MKAFWTDELMENGGIYIPNKLVADEGLNPAEQIVMGTLMSQINYAMETNQVDTNGRPYTTMTTSRLERLTGIKHRSTQSGLKKSLVAKGLIVIVKQKQLRESGVITKRITGVGGEPHIWYINDALYKQETDGIDFYAEIDESSEDEDFVVTGLNPFDAFG